MVCIHQVVFKYTQIEIRKLDLQFFFFLMTGDKEDELFGFLGQRGR